MQSPPLPLAVLLFFSFFHISWVIFSEYSPYVPVLKSMCVVGHSQCAGAARTVAVSASPSMRAARRIRTRFGHELAVDIVTTLIVWVLPW